jgi:hypothetical protein
LTFPLISPRATDLNERIWLVLIDFSWCHARLPSSEPAAP